MNTRTSSPALWSWMRAPSSLYSNAAGPSRSSAASTSSAVLASMGETGDSRRSEKRASPAAPSSSATRATSPTLPEYIAACRTSAGGRPAARAMASDSTPSSAPCRSSPTNSSTRNRRSSGARAGEQVPQRAASRRSADPAPALRRDDVARAIDVEEGQRLAFRRGLGHRRLERPPAEADPPLGQRPRQVQRRELGLASARLAAGGRPAARPSPACARSPARARRTPRAPTAASPQDNARC